MGAMVWWKEYVETSGTYMRRNLIVDSEVGQLLILNDIDPANPILEIKEENIKTLNERLGFLLDTLLDDKRHSMNDVSQALRVFLSNFICDAIDLIQQDIYGILDVDQESYLDPYGLR